MMQNYEIVSQSFDLLNQNDQNLLQGTKNVFWRLFPQM